MKTNVILTIIAALIASKSFSQQPHKIYVSATAASNGAGTAKSPVGTLEKALSLAAKASSATGVKAVEVVVAGGTYFISKTLELVEGKNWQSKVSLSIHAMNNQAVVIHGGKKIPLASLKPVTDPAWISRFPENIRARIKMIDLTASGIGNVGKLRPVGFSRPFGVAWMEPFFDNKPGHLARWPNDSMIMIGRLVDSGGIPRWGNYSPRGGSFHYEGTDRPSRWKEPAKAWISGYFMWGYADDAVPLNSIDTTEKIITAAIPHMYGFASGKPYRRFYAFNIPEEIDMPGEYYLDYDKKIMYFLPPANLKTMELSVLEEPMIALEGVRNVQITGIDFTCSRGMGIYMERTEGVRINHCSFSNLGMMAVSMGKGILPGEQQRHAGTGIPASRIVGDIVGHVYENSTFDREAGSNNGLTDCTIYQTGSGGVFLSGGDRVTLVPGKSFVNNCSVRNYNRIEKTYRPGIWISGVGNSITNCEVADGPSMGVLLQGNDHLAEYNNIHDVCLAADDMGAFYHGRDPSERGNIIRYNYFHHIGGSHRTMAIYHDDGECGTQVYGNIFFKAATVAGFIGGGRDNKYTNNIFIDTKFASHIDDRLNNWAFAMLLPDTGLFLKRLNAVNYNKPPYSIRYPDLKNYFEDDPAMPKRDTFHLNLLVNIGKRTEEKGAQLPFTPQNLEITHDPGFVDYGSEDFRLKKDSEVWNKLPGFKAIPVENIGFKPVRKQATTMGNQ